ncbi:hypothetical protein Tco_1415488 [Tanacetum coccineum]
MFKSPARQLMPQECTPPFEEAMSPVCKRSSSTTPLSHAYVERCEVPTASAKNVSVGRNVRRRLLTSYSSVPINARGFSGTAEPHLGPTNTIGNHDTANGNCVPIFKISIVLGICARTTLKQTV